MDVVPSSGLSSAHMKISVLLAICSIAASPMHAYSQSDDADPNHECRSVREVRGTQKAFITGMGGTHVHLFPAHPFTCQDSHFATCQGKAYLLPGDEVRRGGSCEGWTLVEYRSKRNTTTGWVDASILEPLTTSPTAPPVCGYVQEQLNQQLKSKNIGSPSAIFISPLRNVKTLDQVPDWGSNGDLGWQTFGVQLAQARIGVHDMDVLAYGTGGTCNNSVVTIWNKQHSKQLEIQGANGSTIDSEYPNESGGYTSQELITWHDGIFFLQFSRAAHHVRVFSIRPDLSSTFLCEMTQRPVAREPIISAAEPALCEAASTGNVQAIYPTDSAPVDEKTLPVGEVGSYVGSADSMTLSGAFHADIRNSGKPERVAMAGQYSASGAGCGGEGQREWPVILKSDDRPDQSDPLNQKAYEVAGGDDTSRLFGYGGKVFFEHRSVGGADSHNHEIWQFSRDGAAKVCDYAMVQYRVEKVGRPVRNGEP
jgi:hypothetical protein